MSKKQIIVVVCGILVIGSFYFLITRQSRQLPLEKSKVDKIVVEKQAVETEHKNEIVQYENIDGLYFLTKNQGVEFKENLESWLNKEGMVVDTVTVHNAIEEHLSEKRWVFYLILDTGKNKVKGTYVDGGQYGFTFVDALSEAVVRDIEQSEKEEIKVTEEERLNVNESYDPTSEMVDVGKVKIAGLEKLSADIDIIMLEDQVTEYLTLEKEYRRELVVFDVVKEDKITNIWLNFSNPRVDKKCLFLIVREGKLDISFVEERIKNDE